MLTCAGGRSRTGEAENIYSKVVTEKRGRWEVSACCEVSVTYQYFSFHLMEFNIIKPTSFSPLPE